MKIGSLSIIFILIILPISLLLSIYMQNQLKTLNYQISYDSKLYNSTYDAIKAFQINTINNTASDMANSKIRDIQASVNTFFNSLGSNFDLSGYNKEVIQEYVPAIVFTMYDGYYIYSPYENIVEFETNANNEKNVKINTKSNNTQYGFKPYVYYTKRYIVESDDIIINYSLDNYIKVRGIIDEVYENKSGYVIDYMNIRIENASNQDINDYDSETDVSNWDIYYRDYLIEEKEQLTELVGTESYPYAKIDGTKYYLETLRDNNNNEYYKVFSIMNGDKIYEDSADKVEIILNNDSAKRYYIEAYKFSKWIDEKLKEKIGDVFGEIGNYDSNTIVESNSNFNSERFEVIKNSIETNLSTAIAGYNKYYKTNTNFQMPKLKETEWELLLNNVCAISFLQGLSIGGKIYNGYCVIPNNKTEEVVSENSIYITDNEYYYKVSDKSLLDENITINNGYFNLDFETMAINNDNEVIYYIPKTQLGSYTSIVGSSGVSSNWNGNVHEYFEKIKVDPDLSTAQKNAADKLAQVYYTALGRERYGMYKAK